MRMSKSSQPKIWASSKRRSSMTPPPAVPAIIGISVESCVGGGVVGSVYSTVLLSELFPISLLATTVRLYVTPVMNSMPASDNGGSTTGIA